jgi:GAF domain-containing protein
MFQARDLRDLPKPELYRELAAQLHSLIEHEPDRVANLASAAALLFHSLGNLNWCGFYLLHDNELVVGPFQGRPACVRISLGRGVCGAAAAQRKTLRVPDVADFPGHIACDPASRSEIVVPLLRKDSLLGVLDLDSPQLDRFDAEDARGLEAFVAILAPKI